MNLILDFDEFIRKILRVIVYYYRFKFILESIIKQLVNFNSITNKHSAASIITVKLMIIINYYKEVEIINFKFMVTVISAE